MLVTRVYTVSKMAHSDRAKGGMWGNLVVLEMTLLMPLPPQMLTITLLRNPPLPWACALDIKGRKKLILVCGVRQC